MTNGEYITKMVEQDEDFCIFKDDMAETVTIEVSLAWWNKPKEQFIKNLFENIFIFFTTAIVTEAVIWWFFLK